MAGLDNAFGAYLRTARRRADLSQRELAAKAGVPRSTVARVECGRCDPRLSTVVRLVAAADCRLAVVRGGDELPPLPDAPFLRDRNGRRFPAHLDPHAVQTYLDWWRSSTYKRHPPLPPFTYTWVRARRDFERARIRRAFVVRGRLGRGPNYGSNL